MVNRILSRLGQLSASEGTDGQPSSIAQIAGVSLIFLAYAIETFVYGIFLAIPTYLVLEFIGSPRGMPATAFARVLLGSAGLGMLRGLWHSYRYLSGEF